MSRLTADTAQIKAAFGSSASEALRNLFMFLGAVIMMVVSARNCRSSCPSPSRIVLPLVYSGRAVGRRGVPPKTRLQSPWHSWLNIWCASRPAALPNSAKGGIRFEGVASPI